MLIHVFYKATVWGCPVAGFKEKQFHMFQNRLDKVKKGKVHQRMISILIMMQPPPVWLLEVVDNGTVIFLSSFDSSLSTCALLLSEA